MFEKIKHPIAFLAFFKDFPAILIFMIIDKFDGSDHIVVTSHQKN